MPHRELERILDVPTPVAASFAIDDIAMPDQQQPEQQQQYSLHIEPHQSLHVAPQQQLSVFSGPADAINAEAASPAGTHRSHSTSSLQAQATHPNVQQHHYSDFEALSREHSPYSASTAPDRSPFDVYQHQQHHHSVRESVPPARLLYLPLPQQTPSSAPFTYPLSGYSSNAFFNSADSAMSGASFDAPVEVSTATAAGTIPAGLPSYPHGTVSTGAGTSASASPAIQRSYSAESVSQVPAGSERGWTGYEGYMERPSVLQQPPQQHRMHHASKGSLGGGRTPTGTVFDLAHTQTHSRPGTSSSGQQSNSSSRREAAASASGALVHRRSRTATRSRAATGESVSRPTTSGSGAAGAFVATTHGASSAQRDSVASGVYAGQTYDDIYGGEQDGGSGHTDRHDMDTDAEEAPDESAGMTGRKRGAAAKRRPSKKGGKVADESSKKAKNRESSQRFRDRAKERSNAIQERMKWLEDRVKYLELELEAARSGVPLPASAASASAITAPDPMPAASIRAAEEKKEQAAAENAGLNVLRRENVSLRRSLKAAEEVIESLREQPPISPPHSWPYPHGAGSAVQLSPRRRSGTHASIASRTQRTSHSRNPSYASSFSINSASQAFDSHPSSSSGHGHGPGQPASAMGVGLGMYSNSSSLIRARSSSAASDFTMASSVAPSERSSSGGPASFSLSRSSSLHAQFHSSLPTVPGSATIPTASFADFQVAGLQFHAGEYARGSHSHAQEQEHAQDGQAGGSSAGDTIAAASEALSKSIGLEAQGSREARHSGSLLFAPVPVTPVQPSSLWDAAGNGRSNDQGHVQVLPQVTEAPMAVQFATIPSVLQRPEGYTAAYAQHLATGGWPGSAGMSPALASYGGSVGSASSSRPVTATPTPGTAVGPSGLDFGNAMGPDNIMDIGEGQEYQGGQAH